MFVVAIIILLSPLQTFSSFQVSTSETPASALSILLQSMPAPSYTLHDARKPPSVVLYQRFETFSVGSTAVAGPQTTVEIISVSLFMTTMKPKASLHSTIDISPPVPQVLEQPPVTLFVTCAALISPKLTFDGSLVDIAVVSGSSLLVPF